MKIKARTTQSREGVLGAAVAGQTEDKEAGGSDCAGQALKLGSLGKFCRQFGIFGYLDVIFV